MLLALCICVHIMVRTCVATILTRTNYIALDYNTTWGLCHLRIRAQNTHTFTSPSVLTLATLVAKVSLVYKAVVNFYVCIK